MNTYDPKTIYLDTETTGLNKQKDDEILEISIIDDWGNPLIDTLINPLYKKQWTEAEAIHGISPGMVKNAPNLEQVIPKIVEVITDKNLIIYNKDYDMGFFSSGLSSMPENIQCAMAEFAELYGEVNQQYGGYKWKSLIHAAKHVNHKWTGQAHRALADTLATRSVWHWIQNQTKGKYHGEK